RRSLAQQAFYVSALIVTLVCSGLWTNSYFQNKKLINQFKANTAVYTALAQEDSNTAINFPGLLKEMDALRSVRDVYPENDIPWSIRLG
ncbi:MAG: hypothetical protein KAI17_08520, partial [Thiotrichaceae bacterium]|nr:hypothetical protein [Thiotrichaceae bacterium]